MVPYLICFLICILFTYLAGNIKVKIGRASIPSIIFSIIAIIPPCLLAGLRDNTIGRDVLVYGDKLFSLAMQNNTIVSFFSHTDVEILFGLLTFFVAHLFSRQVYYFILQLLVILPIYKALFDNNLKKYAWLGMLIYLFWLYPFSLNIMRQSISISILIWNYKNIREKKVFKYLFWCLVSAGFHITGIIAILFYLIYYMTTYNTQKESKYELNRLLFRIFKRFNKILIIIGSLIIVLLGVKLVEFVSGTTGYYIDQLSFKTDGNLDLVNIVLMTMSVGIIYKYRNKDNEIGYLIFLTIIGAILYQLKSSLSQMYRISVYFTSFLIMLYPMVLNKSQNKRERYLIVLGISIISFIFFWYYIVVRGWHSIYPYVFLMR